MKKITLIILLLSPFFAMAQPGIYVFNDSASIKINISIQARDAEYIGSHVAFKEEYDSLFDQFKLKMRIATPPINQGLVAIDSISVGTWLMVANYIRKDYIAVQGGVYTRLEALLKAKNNAYLTRLLNEANTFDTRQYQDSRQRGRFAIRRSN